MMDRRTIADSVTTSNPATRALPRSGLSASPAPPLPSSCRRRWDPAGPRPPPTPPRTETSCKAATSPNDLLRPSTSTPLPDAATSALTPGLLISTCTKPPPTTPSHAHPHMHSDCREPIRRNHKQRATDTRESQSRPRFISNACSIYLGSPPRRGRWRGGSHGSACHTSKCGARRCQGVVSTSMPDRQVSPV